MTHDFIPLLNSPQWAVLSSSMFVVIGVMYKTYRLIKDDRYTDRLREVSLEKFKPPEYEIRVREINMIMSELK